MSTKRKYESLKEEATLSQPRNNNNNPGMHGFNANDGEDPFKQVQEDELEDGDDDDEDEDEQGRGGSKRPANAKRAGRRKIKIEYIQEKSRRHITFSKRKSGIMKKAYELSTLTGTQVLLLVVSETGLVYTFTTPKLQPIVTKEAGRSLIQACLHSTESSSTAGAAAAGASSGAEDNDNDEAPHEEDEDAEGQRESGAEGEEGSDNDENQDASASGNTGPPLPPTSGPPLGGHQYPRPHSYPHPHAQAQQQHPQMMYPPPYSHIPYPAVSHSGAPALLNTSGAPGVGGHYGHVYPAAGGGGEPPGGGGGGPPRQYWEHPAYGYPHYPPPQLQHQQQQQYQKQQGQDVETLRKEE